MKSASRCLIVNADDFGMSPGVNEGIAEAYEHGILTSASMMVRWPAAVQAAAYARRHPRLSVGLHLDLGEWTFQDEAWQLAYQVVPMEEPQAVAEEIVRQFQQFRQLMGCEPSHLDSHQHVHETEPIRSLCLKAARERRIVLRNTVSDVRYCGDFYGQSDKGYPYPEGISAAWLIKLLENLPAGVTEFGCHPAKYADMQGMYRDERVVECETLCRPEVRAAITAERISLRSFLTWRDQGAESSTR